MVTLCGQEILRAGKISVGGVTPREWQHFIVSLLCHDIGYVRGVYHEDGDGQYVINAAGDKGERPLKYPQSFAFSSKGKPRDGHISGLSSLNERR
jgi:hypothetical protein